MTATAAPHQATPLYPTVVGTLSLLPLPGSDGWRGLCAIQKKAMLARVEQETYALLTAGVDAICVENTHDFPFAETTAGRVDVAVATLMTQAVALVQSLTELPVGVSMLPNDPETALAIAMSTEARFIRVPVLLGTRVTETGMMPSRLQALTAAYRRWQISPADVVPWVDVTSHHILPLQRTHQPWDNPSLYLLDLLKTCDAQPLTGKLIIRQPDLVTETRQSSTTGPQGSAAKCPWPHPLIQLQQVLNHPVMVELTNLPHSTAQLAPLAQQAAGIIIGSQVARKPSLHNRDTTPAIDPFGLEGLIQQIRACQPLRMPAALPDPTVLAAEAAPLA